MTEEKKAEIAALKQKMAEQKEETKEAKDNAEHYRLMKEALNTTRTLKRKETALF